MVMRFSGLDLNLLIALNALLEERSVTKAAERLNTSQPAMSAALGKLREFFGDELLIRAGRDMLPTAQANFLLRPIAEVLAAIQTTMNSKPVFDAATEVRAFKLMMSDYMGSIILPPLLNHLREHAKSITLDVIQSDETMLTKLERGEVDLAIAPEKYLNVAHPHEPISQDDYVAVVDKKNRRVGKRMTLEQYLEADHVVVNLSDDRSTMFEDWFLEHFNATRRYVVSVPLFSMVPALVVGTTLVGTMHRRLATQLSQNFEIKIVELPGNFPSIKECAQWHRLRSHDLGLVWLREQIVVAAKLGEQLAR